MEIFQRTEQCLVQFAQRLTCLARPLPEQARRSGPRFDLRQHKVRLSLLHQAQRQMSASDFAANNK